MCSYGSSERTGTTFRSYRHQSTRWATSVACCKRSRRPCSSCGTRLCLESREFLLDTVSTTCGSGWVRSCAATELLYTGVKAAHPPATAGGTDCPTAIRTFPGGYRSILFAVDAGRSSVHQLSDAVSHLKNHRSGFRQKCFAFLLPERSAWNAAAS